MLHLLKYLLKILLDFCGNVLEVEEEMIPLLPPSLHFTPIIGSKITTNNSNNNLQPTTYIKYLFMLTFYIVYPLQHINHLFLNGMFMMMQVTDKKLKTLPKRKGKYSPLMICPTGKGE